MTTAITAAAYRATRAATPSKYHARRTTVDGVTFDSQKEAREYVRLKLAEKHGLIRAVECQPAFVLHTPGWQIVGVYRADFRYWDGPAFADCHVIDVKGFATPLYRWKKKHAEAEYGIRIEER
jgi:hypothetical protein